MVHIAIAMVTKNTVCIGLGRSYHEMIDTNEKNGRCKDIVNDYINQKLTHRYGPNSTRRYCLYKKKKKKSGGVSWMFKKIGGASRVWGKLVKRKKYRGVHPAQTV